MPNQRQPGTKLAGAYISAEKDNALDEAIAENEQALKKPKTAAELKKSVLRR